MLRGHFPVLKLIFLSIEKFFYDYGLSDTGKLAEVVRHGITCYHWFFNLFLIYEQVISFNHFIYSQSAVFLKKAFRLSEPGYINLYENSEISKLIGNSIIQPALRKKCPYSELFWSAFSRILTEYEEIFRISPYSGQNAGKCGPE